MFGGVHALLPFLLMNVVGNICCEQLMTLYCVAFFCLLFLSKAYFFVFLFMLPLFHVTRSFCSLRDSVDDLDDFCLDLKVRKSPTKHGKSTANTEQAF